MLKWIKIYLLSFLLCHQTFPADLNISEIDNIGKHVSRRIPVKAFPAKPLSNLAAWTELYQTLVVLLCI